MAALVVAIHTLRFAWVFMGRRDKPGDDGFLIVKTDHVPQNVLSTTCSGRGGSM